MNTPPAASPLRVLLLSPVEGIDPACGDTVYTAELMASPPPGVEYEDYASALAGGRLVEHGRREALLAARGAQRISELASVGRARFIDGLRRRGVLFREPFREFSVRPGTYDLVHCHVFSVSFRNRLPLVISNAGLLDDLYLGARRWSPRRVRRAVHGDALLAAAMGVQHASLRAPKADRFVCFTDSLRDALVARGAVDPAQVEIIPIPVRVTRQRAEKPPTTIGFIATDFEAKGGATVLRAWSLIQSALPRCRLLIVGSEPRLSAAEALAARVEWLPRVSRDHLVRDLLPSVDVLAYPTRADGMPLVVLEALGAGIPAAVSDYRALPEIIGGHGNGGLVSGIDDAPGLANNLLRLLRSEEHAEFSARARRLYECRYSPVAVGAKLRSAYDAAIAAARVVR